MKGEIAKSFILIHSGNLKLYKTTAMKDNYSCFAQPTILD